MVKKEFEPDDPMEMIGVELPRQTEEEIYDMALCFAEEFVRQGWGKEKLANMFRNPFYQGPYLVWKEKGNEFIDKVIDEATAMWRQERRAP